MAKEGGDEMQKLMHILNFISEFISTQVPGESKEILSSFAASSFFLEFAKCLAESM